MVLPLLIGAVASVAGAAISARGARSHARRQNRHNSPDQIRERFEGAGFNPLLGVGPIDGTDRSSYQPFMGNAISQVGGMISDWAAEKERLKMEKTRLEMQQKQLAKELKHSQKKGEGRGVYSDNGSSNLVSLGARQGTQKIEINATGTTALSQARPSHRPTMNNRPRIPVFLPDGQQRMVVADQVQRLGINAWDTISAGDYAELVGEIRGEAESVLAAQKIGQHSGIPVLSSRTDLQKKADKEYADSVNPRPSAYKPRGGVGGYNSRKGALHPFPFMGHNAPYLYH